MMPILAVLACGHDGVRDLGEPTPAPASPAPAPAPTPTPAPTPVPRTCAAPFEVLPAYPDTFVDQAAAGPAADGGAWSTTPMRGPAASFELAAPGCTELTRLPAAAPFDAIIHCSTGQRTRPLGPDNVATHVLAVHTTSGWWTHDLVREYWPHGDREDQARVARVHHLAAQDRVDDGGAEITAVTEDGPPGGAQTRALIACGGEAAHPSCARIPFSAGGPFHGAKALQYRLQLACDGALDLAGWEGGARVVLVHGRYTLHFP
ncbi:MAG: hypothetical protein NT062_11460 [Proteobacteria bacterium]|nr:hypothetical protein [Pseudomonadota bacterium]